MSTIDAPHKIFICGNHDKKIGGGLYSLQFIIYDICHTSHNIFSDAAHVKSYYIFVNKQLIPYFGLSSAISLNKYNNSGKHIIHKNVSHVMFRKTRSADYITKYTELQ